MLGRGFEAHTIHLQDDSEGEVVATLVRSRPRFTLLPQPLRNVDVLYVHGWTDYFFQREVAKFYTSRGATFYALDLRKYGRSLRPHQTPGYIESLETYDEDIAAALRVIGHRPGGSRRLVAMGHSMGGLILSLWASRHPNHADALVLNSPWIETLGTSVARTIAKPLMKATATVSSRVGSRLPVIKSNALNGGSVAGRIPSPDLGFYWRSISSQADGEWDLVDEWRPQRGFVPYAVWLAAILAGHTRVASGLDLRIPVLTLLAAKSTIQPRWSKAMMTTDSVLIVDDMAKAATNLGSDVTVIRIENAMHDVFLSKREVRAEAFAQLEQWLTGYGLSSSRLRATRRKRQR